MFAERTNWNFDRNRLSEALARRRVSGKPLLDLTVSNPTTSGFAFDGDAIMAALRNPGVHRYEPEPQGLEVARRAVAAYYAARGDSVAVEDIFLAASTSEAYSYIFRAICNPDDEVLIPAPGYPLFDFLADIQDVKLVRYPLLYDRGWQIDFHGLQQAIRARTRAVIVVNPNNPTGHFVTAADVMKLNEVCRTRKLVLICDEVFLDFALGKGRAVSLATNDGTLTFTMSGLSKICGLPQMKVAWLIISGPEDLRRQAVKRLELIADTYLSVSTPAQLATARFLELREGFQRQLMARVRENLAELERQLARHVSCVRLRVEGGWYAILRVPATRSDEELAIELLEKKGVYVHPGHFYDFHGEGHLVVSLIAAPQDFAEGVRRLLSVF
jgi:alanine-synthesizing transaminase